MVEVGTKMKSGAMLLSFIVLFSLAALFLVASPALAGQGCGSNWLGSDNNDQDFWVSKNQNLGSSGFGQEDQGPPAPPSSSEPNMSMPEPLPEPLAAENETDQNDNETALANNSNTSAPAQPQPLEVGGKWLIKLGNSTDRSIELNLFPSGRNIIAGGTLSMDGAVLTVAGTGSLDDRDLFLKVKTEVSKWGNQIDKRYDLDLAVENGLLSGTYKEYSGEKLDGEGKAYASR
jgi:hypothetical protein